MRCWERSASSRTANGKTKKLSMLRGTESNPVLLQPHKHEGQTMVRKVESRQDHPAPLKQVKELNFFSGMGKPEGFA